MAFEDFSRPFIRTNDQDFSTPECKFRDGTCNIIAGMACARYSGTEEPPAEMYYGKTICHGQRPLTAEEQQRQEEVGWPDSTVVCDIEVIVARDF